MFHLFRTRLFLFSSGLSLVLGPLILPPARANGLRTIALTGDTAPGAGQGAIFSEFDNLSLNNKGEAVFLAGGSKGVLNSIWTERSGNELRQVVRRGQVAPGTEDQATFSSVYFPQYSDNEITFFAGSLESPERDNTNSFSFWLDGIEDGLVLSFDSREGFPGIDGNATLGTLISTFLNRKGEYAFVGHITGVDIGAENDTAVWVHKSGEKLALIAREGMFIPFDDGMIQLGRMSEVSLNDKGQTAVLMQGQLRVDSSAVSGVLIEDHGQYNFVALGNENAPGMSEGETFAGVFWALQLNNNGHTSFAARLSRPNESYSNSWGLWSEKGDGGLSLISRTGFAAPGIEEGVVFEDLDSSIFNQNDQTAFWGRLTGPGIDDSNDEGIWSDAWSDDVSLVVREGERAPGTEEGVRFGYFGNYTDYPVLSLNSRGQIAFTARLEGDGISYLNNHGIWASDANGILRLIARTGETIDVDNGEGTDLRTISYLEFDSPSGNTIGRLGPFNEIGQIAFSAKFTDGSQGIFVSNVVAIPEPGSNVTLLITCVTPLLVTLRTYHVFER